MFITVDIAQKIYDAYLYREATSCKLLDLCQLCTL